MTIRQVSPEDASRLLQDGWVYVDVRSEPEFERGHAPGAYNVPLLHAGPAGMTPNPEFEAVMQRCFGVGERLVLGCRSGARSQRAAELLQRLGYAEVVNLSSGFEGSRDAFGRPLPGWAAAGLPVEAGLTEGLRYADARSRAPR